MYSTYKEWKLTEFGKKVEKLRKEKGIPKTKLSKRLGISVVYYNFIIHGLRPGYRQRDKILKILNEVEEDKEYGNQNRAI